MGMAMTEPRLILSTISQIKHQEQERIQPSYRLSLKASGQSSKSPARRKPCGALFWPGEGAKLHFVLSTAFLLIRSADVCINAFLWERRPRRDRASQTTPHRPEGGAPTLIAELIAVPNTNLLL